MYYVHKSREITSGPSREPVTVPELRTYGRIDSSEDTNFLSDLIATARQMVEEYLGVAMINRTVVIRLDDWPEDTDQEDAVIRLPDTPVSAVAHVKYYDEDNDQQTWAAANYDADLKSDPPRITLSYGKTWPSLRSRTQAVEIQYTAGYGANASDVPKALQMIVKAAALDLYERRDQNLDMNLSENPAIRNLAAAYRRHGIL